jgi:hypothetical protein
VSLSVSVSVSVYVRVRSFCPVFSPPRCAYPLTQGGCLGKFIEAGQYKENLYGTSISAVKQVAESNMHCVLDVTAAALDSMIQAQLNPVVIYLRPASPEVIMAQNPSLSREQVRVHAVCVCVCNLALTLSAHAQAEALFEHAKVNESSFSGLIVVIVENKDINATLTQVTGEIRKSTEGVQWVTTGDDLP